MKKSRFITVLAIMLIAMSSSPIFAVSSGAFEDLTELESPIVKFFTILKAISVCCMIAFSFVIAIKYLASNGQQKNDTVRGWFIALAVAGAMVAVAYSVPKIFGLGDVASSSGAITMIEPIMSYITPASFVL